MWGDRFAVKRFGGGEMHGSRRRRRILGCTLDFYWWSAFSIICTIAFLALDSYGTVSVSFRTGRISRFTKEINFKLAGIQVNGDDKKYDCTKSESELKDACNMISTAAIVIFALTFISCVLILLSVVVYFRAKKRWWHVQVVATILLAVSLALWFTLLDNGLNDYAEGLFELYLMQAQQYAANSLRVTKQLSGSSWPLVISFVVSFVSTFVLCMNVRFVKADDPPPTT